MTRKRKAITWVVIGWLLLTGATPAASEFSVDPDSLNLNNINLIIMGIITEGPDPWDLGYWFDHRLLPSQYVLNPSGDGRGDGRPAVAWDPTTGWPLVVWAYNAGSDHDIAFSQWDGTSWTPTEFLTSKPTDELDPRVFVKPDGEVLVVWWETGVDDEVYFSTRAAGSTIWGPAVPVTGLGDHGRRPSVAVWNNRLYVAYERDSDSPGMAQEVVVVNDDFGGGGPVTDVVGETARTDALDPVLHVEQGNLWVDWKQSDTSFCFAEALPAGGWVGPTVTAATEASWLGEETTRRQIRAAVLSN